VECLSNHSCTSLILHLSILNFAGCYSKFKIFPVLSTFQSYRVLSAWSTSLELYAPLTTTTHVDLEPFISVFTQDSGLFTDGCSREERSWLCSTANLELANGEDGWTPVLCTNFERSVILEPSKSPVFSYKYLSGIRAPSHETCTLNNLEP
jgi:hypothetical protein